MTFAGNKPELVPKTGGGLTAIDASLYTRNGCALMIWAEPLGTLVETMARNCKPLTFKQLRAVIMLAAGDQVKVVATSIGVNRETIRRWRQNPHLQAVCADYTERLFEGALSEVQAKLSKAIGWLEDSHDAAAKDSDKIKAAAVIINAAFRSHEIAVLKRELSKLRNLQDLVKQLMSGAGTTAPGHLLLPLGGDD